MAQAQLMQAGKTVQVAGEVFDLRRAEAVRQRREQRRPRWGLNGWSVEAREGSHAAGGDQSRELGNTAAEITRLSLDVLKGRAEFQPMLNRFNERIGAVIALLEAGDNAAAAERFVTTVAFGPGAWDSLPQPIRDTFVRTAPTFLDETRDPEGLTIELASLQRFDHPALLSIGTESPPFFKPIVQTVAGALSTSTRYLRGSRLRPAHQPPGTVRRNRARVLPERGTSTARNQPGAAGSLTPSWAAKNLARAAAKVREASRLSR